MAKKIALYPGCMMSTEQYAYELSVRNTLPELGVQLIDIKGFSCCGEPLKSVNQLLTIFLSARNLALIEKEKLNVLAPCAMCNLALCETQHILKENPEMEKRINDYLSEEGLKYTGNIKIYHILDYLYDEIGIEEIKKHVKKPLENLSFATHYGCHCIRPKEIGRPDDSENPQKMEEILNAIGAKTPPYPEKLDCCGGLLQLNLDESALTKSGQKLKAVSEQGYDGLVDVCPWCHKMFDARQKKSAETVATKVELPVFYLTQLIGMTFGINNDKLGLNLNLSAVEKIKI